MKKLFSLIVAMFATLNLASAAVDLTVGARGIFGLDIGMHLGDPDYETDMNRSLDFGGAVFAKIPLYEGLGLQVEVGYTYNDFGQKLDYDDLEYKEDVSYRTIDIPLLVTYDIKANDILTISPLFGPRFSIPVGDATVRASVDSEEYEDDVKIDNVVLFSLVTGVNVAFRAGPGAILGDIRYNNGVSQLTLDYGNDAKDVVFTPRNLQFSVGYQLPL